MKLQPVVLQARCLLLVESSEAVAPIPRCALLLLMTSYARESVFFRGTHNRTDRDKVINIKMEINET